MSSYFRALRLVNFRNYESATVFFAPGLNVAVGENAQGKTNLLEGISFAISGSSTRTASDSEVVRWGADFARVEGRIARPESDERRIAVGYAPGQKKRITIDGAPERSLADYAAGGAGVRAITFFPDDIRIVKGAPSDRREFLDALLSSLRPAYANAAAEYTKAVQQRNHLLRRIRDGYSSGKTLDTWDRKVAQLGTEVLEGRERALPHLGEHFASSMRDLYGPEKAAVTYSGTATPESYSERLREAQSADVERGTTSVGPHRDDLKLTLGGVDLTVYGSQGQQRLATLGLKFAAREYVRGTVGEDPILLMDDVMSELDERRREYLTEYFLHSAQAVVSTTNLDYFGAGTLGRAKVIRISGGRIESDTTACGNGRSGAAAEFQRTWSQRPDPE
ncbi:recf: DNA replication and repair protein RecF [Rubrobacter radiotolerans]|uniref:DNA replication and repair protein RecF n=1 Tax=Rubrobacter radiotolerans TaxID=42256 RepID=A0A023WYI3_RUBRA|nr:DNA replication/repair protein RecF [Rubrobacter radiotolerans]AHY45287.1 recf: DNA replication and repair protein RecF [Rubrobacter radiotolerans]MDX5892699.1 DNA replication/repair protein RecF [Rubrobacter radiotolerans]SMC02308.1 DNA replication and repair protein RecF [Rubrobacter radiotolerans DSM 5868]